MSFLANTEKEKKEILQAIGVNQFKDLIKNIPKTGLFSPNKNGILRKGLSEMEVVQELQTLAAKNKTVENFPSFLGAGAYHHFIPSVIHPLITRGEFLTAYTPYQPEASQGTLQTTFEFQTMIAELYGMDVANASLYDGASALTEGIFLALRETGRKKVLVAKSVHPEYRETIKTYCKNFEIIEIDFLENGELNLIELEKYLDHNTAAVALQNPNFFGTIEEGEKIAALTKSKGALFVVSANPLAMGFLTPPGNYGADIATGEGQPLGIPLHFGGPYLGLFACKQNLMRKIPGRICGMTKDIDGKRGYVLTLQTREQHIRREKATSNICTNEALMALAATVYLTVVGPQGLKEVCELNVKKSHYAAEQIAQLNGYKIAFQSPFFNEFVVRSQTDPVKINDALSQKGIVGGLPLASFYPELKDCTLYCVTEMNSKQQIDYLVQTLKGIAL